MSGAGTCGGRGRMLAGCPGSPGTGLHPRAWWQVLDAAGRRRRRQGKTKQEEEALDMDVENILAKAGRICRCVARSAPRMRRTACSSSRSRSWPAEAAGARVQRVPAAVTQPPVPVARRGGHGGARRSTAGLTAPGRRRGLRRPGAAVRRLRREGRPGPLGTGSGRDDRGAGFAEPGAGARPHVDPPARGQPALTFNSGPIRGRPGCALRVPGQRRLQREAPAASSQRESSS